MINVRADYSDRLNFFGPSDPVRLVREFGSPLYVYNEAILRRRCREMRDLVDVERFVVSYSSKANSNIHLLGIIRGEGLRADAMSPGEIFVLLEAGFSPDEILYISNNVSAEEMLFAVERGVTVSVDSLSQLDRFGEAAPGRKVAVRFNPGLGAGHHEKVITGGMSTKFGVAVDEVGEVQGLAAKRGLGICGLNQHIGSFFLEPGKYLEAAQRLLGVAERFEALEFIDFGGGFGIPYRKYESERGLNLREFGRRLGGLMRAWADRTGWKGAFQIEPGRYIAAECGILLGTVHAVKRLYGTRYVGTDLGFNVMSRPVIYDAFHDIEIYRESGETSSREEVVSIAGNICETGDIMAQDRLLPETRVGDIIGILDAGAYGYSMCSNYNQRLRPAEVLVREDGRVRLVRRRDGLEDLLTNYR